MTVFQQNRLLLDAFRRGEREALGTVYAAYVRRVAGVLRHGFAFESAGRSMRFRGASDPVELEALTQDVFLRAFAEPARFAYDGLRPYEPYLLRIAKNVVIDEIRRRQKELERLTGPVDEESAARAEEGSAEQELDRARARALVQAFVGERSALEQAYVRARFVDEQNLVTAARAVGITRMRARVLERRLLRELERCLRQRGMLEGGGAEGRASLLVMIALGGL